MQTGRYLHAGAVGFAADQSRRDVCVSELVIQVDHVGHPAGQEELVPLYLTWAEHHTVDVPTCGGSHKDTVSGNLSFHVIWHADKKKKRFIKSVIWRGEVQKRDSPSRVLNSIFSSGSTSFLKHAEDQDL